MLNTTATPFSHTVDLNTSASNPPAYLFAARSRAAAPASPSRALHPMGALGRLSAHGATERAQELRAGSASLHAPSAGGSDPEYFGSCSTGGR